MWRIKMAKVILTETDAGRTTRLTSGPDWEVVGTDGIDNFSIDTGVNAFIAAGGGIDVIKLAGKTSDYKVSGNGSSAVFTYNDGSAVSINAESSGDSISFGDGVTATLRLDASAIKLGAQVLNSTPSIINIAGASVTDDYGLTVDTAGKVAVGGSATGSIETIGDMDPFGVILTAGSTYTIRLQGQGHGAGTLWNPAIVGLYSSTASYYADTSNDDSRADGGTNGRDSLVTFIPKTTDTYYIVAGVAPSASGLGSYTVSVAESIIPKTLPIISLAAPSTPLTAEGKMGVVTPINFIATRTGDLSIASSASWAVTGSGDNPANAVDFAGGVLPSGTVSFSVGQATATVTVNVQGDTDIESDENFTVTMFSAVGAITGVSSVTNKIHQSKSGGSAVTENIYTIPAGIGGGVFTVDYDMHSIADRADIYVNETLAATTRTNVSGAGLLTIPSSIELKANDQVKVVITANDPGTTWDYIVNYREGTPATNNVATGTIVDDDATLPALSIAALNFPAAEGNSGATAYTFTVTRAGNLKGASSATWTVTGSGANPANAADFVGGVLTGTVSFAAGEATQTVTVNVKGDTKVELDEGFTITLSDPIGAILDVSVPGTEFKSTATGGYGVTEKTYVIVGDGSNFKLNYDMLSIPDQADIYVNGNLAATTGRPVSDTGTLTITTALFKDDKIKVVMTGNDPGTIWDYTLDYAGGVSAINYIAAGSIVNDDKDTPTTLTLEPAKISSSEGNSGTTLYTFTVVRSGALSGTSTIDWKVTGAGLNAADATDFVGGVLPSGTLTFAPEEGEKTVEIKIQGDTTVEPDENFIVALSNPAGALLSAPLDVTSYKESGGKVSADGKTTNSYVLANGDGVLTLAYDMKVIPDQAELFINGTLITSTGGVAPAAPVPVAGAGSLTIDSALQLHAGDVVKVVITGTVTDTIWDYTLGYTRGFAPLSTIVNDDFIG
ncbi:MAG: Calx-beta domain-containing protein [Methylobacter sp.]|nr:Calx-beta domain-containing protein [Methylobacter sp.]